MQKTPDQQPPKEIPPRPDPINPSPIKDPAPGETNPINPRTDE